MHARHRERDMEVLRLGERSQGILAVEGSQHLLEGHNICVELRDYMCSAGSVRRLPTAHTRPAMDVVCGDTHVDRKLLWDRLNL